MRTPHLDAPLDYGVIWPVRSVDDLAGFCDFVVVLDEEARIKGSDLYEVYRDWAMREGVHPWSARALNEAVVERMKGVVKRKRMDGVWLDGLRLATPEDRGMTHD